MNWNWIEFWTALTAVATAVLAVVTIAAVGTARKTLKQMRNDSVAQTRPYVYVDVVPGLGGAQMWDVVIRNAGRSSARNLTISVDRWPDHGDNVVESLRPLFNAPRTLPPDCTIRAIWRMELAKGETWGDGTKAPSGMPGDATFTIRYDSDDPSHGGYEDTYSIDVKGVGYTPIPESGYVPHDEMSDTMRQFYQLFGIMARNIREISR